MYTTTTLLKYSGLRPAVLRTLLVGLVGTAAYAVTLPPPPEPAMPKDLPMQSQLYEAQQLAERLALRGAALRTALAERGLKLDSEDRIHVEIVGPSGTAAVDATLLDEFGARVDRTWLHRTDAWVPVDQLTRLAESLPAGFKLIRAQAPHPCSTLGEGPAAMRSLSYVTDGNAGFPHRIAIIDAGFNGLDEAIASGDVPLPSGTYNYTSDAFQSGSYHGTACTETAADHCPAAIWYLFRIDSVTDLGAAVNQCYALDVDVISHSLGYFNAGWHDDEGDACAAAHLYPAIQFYTSAGNFAQQHYQGTFESGSGDMDWHDFAPGVEAIPIDVDAGGSIDCYLQFNLDGIPSYDYDLYLYNVDATELLASSNNGWNDYEDLHWTNTSGSTQRVNLAVYRDCLYSTEFEIFAVGDVTWRDFIVSESSITSPANSTNAEPNVFTVGAVHWQYFEQPPGSIVIEAYSSRGPSNDGNPVIEFCGPSDTTGYTFGIFNGTSAATANAAGAATAWGAEFDSLLWSVTRWLLTRQASYTKDWGTAGRDYHYGYGGLQLAPYHHDTVWLTWHFHEFNGDPRYPYSNVGMALDVVPDGGRLLFIGPDHYPETLVISQPVRLEAIGGPAIIGP